MVLLRWRQKNRENEAAAPSFADLALPLLPSLYNLARWLTRDAAAAEDLVQESLLKALRGFESFETGTNFKAWIFRILRNAYLTSRSGLAASRIGEASGKRVLLESAHGSHRFRDVHPRPRPRRRARLLP